ncbi:hypothetical protein FAES_3569 [Fibrella aestuarina BUZ 2]|uniref:Uncharacterized protein n=1 Tax=Fibrella aestuarina BUZ 2 TaxID=1166018 RepID=I0KBS3_9BACT|nr:hypothetical protein FAES_3569 [Fibrella aestuarina BUZ 2]
MKLYNSQCKVFTLAFSIKLQWAATYLSGSLKTSTINR